MANFLARLKKPNTRINEEAGNIAVAQDELKRVLDVKWWRWRHLYLRARQLQAAKQRSDDSPGAQATIDGIMAQVSDEDRATFELYYQSKLNAAIQTANTLSGQRGIPADPDEIEAELAEQLIRAAEGRDHAQGLGIVPSADGDEYEIMPPEIDPRTLAPGRGRRSSSKGDSAAGAMTPARWGSLAALVVLPVLWFIWSIAGATASAETGVASDLTPAPETAIPGATPTPLTDYSSGEDVTVFYPASLEIERPDSSPIVYRVLASASELGGTWKPEIPEGSAAWLNGTYINHVFCLPPSSMALISTMQRGDAITMRPASGAIRQYEIVATSTVGRQQTEVMDQRRAGLTLIVCGSAASGNANERMVAEAVFRPEALAAAAFSRGDQVVLSNLARLQIKTVRTMPPGDDPAGYVTVEIDAELQNTTSAALDERDIIDQLEIDGGVAERLAPRNTAVEAAAQRLVTYRYRVPAHGGSATWQATSSTGETVRIGLAVAAAPEGKPREPFSATINQAAIRLQKDGSTTMIVIVPVTLQGTRDGAEIPDNFSLWIGERSIALSPQDGALPTTIDQGQTLTIELAAQIPDVAQFEIQIGGQRWRVTLP